MALSFIGGGGGSAILILMGLAALALLAAALFVGSLVLALAKRFKLSALALAISLPISSYLYSIYSEYTLWAEYQRTRKQDFEVAVRLTPDGECLVTVDGVPNRDELILLDGRIIFHIDFPDSRSLRGSCSYFQSRRTGKEFHSLELGRIDISPADRSSFLASIPLPPKGVSYDRQTEAYTVWFRKQTPEFEWFTCARR